LHTTDVYFLKLTFRLPSLLSSIGTLRHQLLYPLFSSSLLFLSFLSSFSLLPFLLIILCTTVQILKSPHVSALANGSFRETKAKDERQADFFFFFSHGRTVVPSRRAGDRGREGNSRGDAAPIPPFWCVYAIL